MGLPRACGGRGWFILLAPVRCSTGTQEAGGGGQPGRKPEVSGRSPEQLAPSLGSMWALVLLWPVVLGFGLEDDSQNTLTYDEDDEMGSAGGVNDGTLGPLTGPQEETPHSPHLRSFPGQVWANNSHVLEIPDSSRALLLGWVSTRLVPALYGLTLLVGLPANGLALWVLATRVPRLPSTVLLMNLAAADLLLALTLPLRIAYYLQDQHWPFGEAACRATTAALYGHMYGSVLLLAAVSLDRYLGVVHPFRALTLRGRRLAAGLCAAAWLAAAALALPLALQRQTFRLSHSDHVLCHDALPVGAQASYWRPAFLCLAVLGCFLPLLVMLLSYGATLCALAASGPRYGHALRLTALVLASAVAFFVPSNILLLLHYSDPRPDAWGDLYAAYVPSLALSTLNSCVDPFIYYYVSVEFRDKGRRPSDHEGRHGGAAATATEHDDC
ncbi:proteinase-activated receptor 4 isoform X2 [Ursus maritimus]|uniref:Proteinase-activated receptor 4 n=1 Tax=Ursus maritimus TaxID=29073 RepID=A0A8M1FRJ3_URSMA|nr:proteinase-activated receptor 4 isoform X2 [Ursus maritimus]